MPKSRKRKSGRRGPTRRPKGRTAPIRHGAGDGAGGAGGGAGGGELPPGGIDPALITSDVLLDLDLSLEAEAAGDIEAAIGHFEASPLAEFAPHLRHLREIRDLGDDTPGWVWSRLVLEQAHRWLLLNDDVRFRAAVTHTLMEIYRHEDPERPRDRAPDVFVADVMAMDWMCREVALYELGGLADYLEQMAQPALLRRADRVLAWPKARMSGFGIREVSGGIATLTDLATGETRRVLNIGYLAEGIGCCVVGRLVPIRSEPGWIFERRPQEVSDDVAEEVAELSVGPDSTLWTEVLGDAVASGELMWPLEAGGCLTPLSSDLVPYTWCTPHGELGEEAYEVCAGALRAAGHGPVYARRAAPYMANVLVDPSVHTAATDRLTSPAHAEAWEAIAANTFEPVRSRCLALASSCRAAA